MISKLNCQVKLWLLPCLMSTESPGDSDRLLTICGSYAKDSSHLSRFESHFAIHSTAILSNGSCKRNYTHSEKIILIALKADLGRP